MKIRMILCIGLVLLTLVSITGVSAETVNVSDSSFNVPEGFEVQRSGENNIVLTSDSTSILVATVEEYDIESIKNNLLDMGYTFLGEEEVDIDGLRVYQQNLTKGNATMAAYIFTKNDKKYGVGIKVVNGKHNLDEYDSVVKEVIKSLN